MRWVVLGDGEEEDRWRDAIRQSMEHELIEPERSRGSSEAWVDDLDPALTAPGVEAVVVGGTPSQRSAWVGRAVELGLHVLCLHPPGPTADPYYQLALLPDGRAAHVVPALPHRLHPAVAKLKQSITEGVVGTRIAMTYELICGAECRLLEEVLPVVLDTARFLLGEVESVTATGSERPGDSGMLDRLVVHLRTASGRTGEYRLARTLGGQTPAGRLTVEGERGRLTWEHGLELDGPSVLWHVDEVGQVNSDALETWSWRQALLETSAGPSSGAASRLCLQDGMRAMELSEAAERSLRRGRTVDMHYDEISELGSFKAVMTSLGCGLVVLVLCLYVLSLVMKALDIPGAGLIAWSVLPLLGFFALLQLLRFAARPAQNTSR